MALPPASPTHPRPGGPSSGGRPHSGTLIMGSGCHVLKPAGMTAAFSWSSLWGNADSYM